MYMKKYIHIVAKFLFSLIIILPIVGLTGALGEPTRELYNTDQAYNFILALTDVAYINYMMAVVHIIALFALWTKREALGALLVLPISLNVVGFHMMIDGGLFTAGALMGNIMLAINLYLLYKNRDILKALTQPKA